MFIDTSAEIVTYTALSENYSYFVLDEKSNSTEKYYSNVDLALLATAVVAMALFGIVSNGLTIYVLHQSVRSVFNYVILSLSMSDLMSAVISPLFLYKNSVGFYQWNLPKFLCKLFWSGDMGTSILTSLHILIFAILRFISLKWPHHFTRFTSKQTKILICILWLAAIAGGFVPFAISIEVKERSKPSIPTCAMSDNDNLQLFKIYYVVTFVVFFYMPCLLVFACSVGSSALFLYRRNKRTQKFQKDMVDQNEKNRQKRENQAILQLALIVGSFLLGYLPISGFYLYLMLNSRKSSGKKVRWWLGMGTHMTLRLSECLNPIFYNLASSKMREETKKCLKKIFLCCIKTQQRFRRRRTKAQIDETDV